MHGAKDTMLTSQQVRGGRAMLGWSARELAEASGVSLNTIQRIEAAGGIPSSSAKTLAAIQTALEAMGIRFTEYGVEMPPK